MDQSGTYESVQYLAASQTVEGLIRENSALHLECEKLGKALKQRKTEAELWKSKYEAQMAQVVQVKATYEAEIRELSAEVQRLHARIKDFDFERQRQAADVRMQVEGAAVREMDAMRRSA